MKNKALFLCYTPLQMVIAEKIIQKNSLVDFDTFVFCEKENDKYNYYYHRLQILSNNSVIFFQKPKNKFLNMLNFFCFKKFYKRSFMNKTRYEAFYLASIDNRFFQYVISKSIGDFDILTFDDGLANIIQNSIYLNSESFFKKAVLYLMGVRYFTHDLWCKSSKHYSIYRDIPNVFFNVENIHLFESGSTISDKEVKEIKIFLGQPFNEVFDSSSKQYIAKIIKLFSIDYYFPHPREREPFIGESEIINTSLIFEDYIVDLMEENPNLRLKLYAITSGAVLNFINNPNIEINYIKNNFLQSRYESFYDLIERLEVNLKHVEI